MLTITHKYLSSHETRKHRHIFARVAAFWQRVFQTLPNLDVHPGVAVYHTLKIFSIVNAKDLLMPHTKFQVCTLKISTTFCHRKKIPLLLNRSVLSVNSMYTQAVISSFYRIFIADDTASCHFVATDGNLVKYEDISVSVSRCIVHATNKNMTMTIWQKCGIALNSQVSCMWTLQGLTQVWVTVLPFLLKKSTGGKRFRELNIYGIGSS